MNCKRVVFFLIIVLGLSGSGLLARAQSGTPSGEGMNSTPAAGTPENGEGGEKKGINITEIVFGHVADSHEWHLFSISHEAEGQGETAIALPLPVLVYEPGVGFDAFMSNNFEEWKKAPDGTKISNSYEGYRLEMKMKEKLVADNGAAVYDLSITKNVLSMLIGVFLLLWAMSKVAKAYKATGSTKAPSGFQNFIEVVVVFIRDEVALPNLGKKSVKYMPLLLTVFFFIWINNLLGLLPGGANFTGNIAVTACLALVTFIVMMAGSTKHFWSHLLNPPDVPVLVKALLVLIEIMSLLIKPVALMIRLFANMLAGHIVILSVICMIFIFGMLNRFVGWGFVPVSLAFSVFMFMLELLVAAIQAFVFTNLTAVFIGQSIEEGHGDAHAHDAKHAH